MTNYLYALKQLNWVTTDEGNEQAHGVNHVYTIRQDKDTYTVHWHNQSVDTSSRRESFKTIQEAKEWAETVHYPAQLTPWFTAYQAEESDTPNYTNPIKNILQWFKDARPNPTIQHTCAQIGAHFEEMGEFEDVFFKHSEPDAEIIGKEKLFQDFFYAQSITAHKLITDLSTEDKKELLDAICDTIVTGTGVAYMLGMDIIPALNEVIASNNSKRNPDGSFNYNESGKIMKNTENYFEPNLIKFIRE